MILLPQERYEDVSGQEYLWEKPEIVGKMLFGDILQIFS
jgi:hypothetical protein